jgi:hypothetical protein
VTDYVGWLWWGGATEVVPRGTGGSVVGEVVGVVLGEVVGVVGEVVVSADGIHGDALDGRAPCRLAWATSMAAPMSGVAEAAARWPS